MNLYLKLDYLKNCAKKIMLTNTYRLHDYARTNITLI